MGSKQMLISCEHLEGPTALYNPHRNLDRNPIQATNLLANAPKHPLRLLKHLNLLLLLLLVLLLLSLLLLLSV